MLPDNRSLGVAETASRLGHPRSRGELQLGRLAFAWPDVCRTNLSGRLPSVSRTRNAQAFEQARSSTCSAVCVSSTCS